MAFLELVIKVFREAPILLMYLFSFALSLITYKKYYQSALRFMPVLLLYTFATELLGAIVSRFKDISLWMNSLYDGNNWVIYHIYEFFELFYLSYIFWSFASEKWHKKTILSIACIYGACMLINPFFEPFLIGPQNFATNIEAIAIIIFTVLYFNDRRKKGKRPFGANDLLSWISLGYMLFLLYYIPYNWTIYRGHIGQHNPYFWKLYNTFQTMIIYLYGCISIGFIFTKKIIARKPDTVGLESL